MELNGQTSEPISSENDDIKASMTTRDKYIINYMDQQFNLLKSQVRELRELIEINNPGRENFYYHHHDQANNGMDFMDGNGYADGNNFIEHEHSISMPILLLPAPINEPVENNSDNVECIFSLIYEKVRYRRFNPFTIRHELRSDKRSSPDQWKASICSLLSSDHISKVSNKEYKINLKSRSDKYVPFDYIMKILKKIALKENDNCFTAGKVLDSICISNRPAANVWDEYFDDLISDGYITIAQLTRGKRYYYKLE
jgi:hypothetical protein